MASIQRKRGQQATFTRRKKVTDSRGNVHWRPDYDNSITVRVAESPDRSARAEVPGQQQINVVILIVPENVAQLYDDAPFGIWAEADYHGKAWDIVTPPSYHHGTRRTRHWTLTLRERPEKVGKHVE